MSNKFNYQYAAIGFTLIILLLIPVQIMVERPMLLLERFFPGLGWMEIIMLGTYGAWIIHRMINAQNTAIWRLRIWLVFCVVFFGQLMLGLIGYDIFLMTGKLHFPIPAMIIAGPVYRLQLGFMPILFITTIIISGPAWCSQLCYFGALDGLLANKGKATRVRYKHLSRITIFVLVILLALGLRATQIQQLWLIVLISLFGLSGIVLILFISRRKGTMVHCTAFCPVGVAVSYLKYVNPFRFQIGPGCTQCRKCTRFCRYDALSDSELKAGKPGITCTYCGDCIVACPTEQLSYRVLWLSPKYARISWIILTVVIHSVFLGLARI